MSWQRPTTPAAMREHAESLRQRAAGLEANSSRRFDSAPGAAVTGGSGRRRSGLHKRTAQAIDGSLADLRRAKELREKAATWSARADRQDPVKIAEVEAKRERKLEARAEVARRESAKRKAAPILNRPDAPHRMTAAEWAGTHRDYKGLRVIEVDGASYRVRSCMQGGASGEVYITDKPAKGAS